MTLKSVLTATLATILVATSASAAVNIAFVNPENFTDVSTDDFSNEKDRNVILNDIGDYLIKKLNANLPDSYIINVAVKDVDLAGEFEPWNMRFGSDVRMVRSVYPARLSLDYEIYDLDGNIVEAGSESLVHRNDYVSYSLRNEDYPYVKELIDDWPRSLK